MKNNSRGFTLLEILLVVGIISILAGIVIVAINPSRQLATVRNTERKTDLKTLYNAMNQFYIDRGYYPASSTLSTALTEVCDTGAVASTSVATDGTSCSSFINLSYDLVPTYIVAIPKDPQGPVLSFLNQIIPTVYAAAGGTGYKIATDANRKIILTTARRELEVEISIGTSTAVVAEEGGATGCTATGGTETTVGGYKIHTFTTSGTLTVTSGCTVDALVVAGGGGGGTGGGGGGGGGGVLIATSSLSATSYTVTVGLGGSGSPDIGTYGNNGATSSFSTIVAIGGGVGGNCNAGACGSKGAGKTGGSGGGGGGGNSDPAYGASGTAGQGYAGGDSGLGGYPYAGGGGGGASQAGITATVGLGGYGGSGITNNYSGSSLVYGGGGGGGLLIDTDPAERGLGGTGGGGNGGLGDGSGGSNGVANTGGGGGGGGRSGPVNNPGGNGGSGVVIIRYAI